MPNDRLFRRIAIVGNAGAGKSSLAREIAKRLGTEAVHLDRLLWEPGWRIVEEGEFRRRHDALLQRENWVIEGLGYPSTLEARFRAADLAIFTRYPLWRCYWWSLKRELRPGIAAGRPDGCPMAPSALRLVRSIWRTQRDVVPEIDRLLARLGPGTQVRVLASPAEVPPLLTDLAP